MFSCRDDASNQALALRWGGEQLEGAHQALNAARAALKKLKAVEKKRKQKVRHMAMCTWHRSVSAIASTHRQPHPVVMRYPRLCKVQKSEHQKGIFVTPRRPPDDYNCRMSQGGSRCMLTSH